MSSPVAVAAPRQSWIDRVKWFFVRAWADLTYRFRESNLEKHARAEMVRAGLYDSGADYGPDLIAGCVMQMCKVLGRQGHSGGSHELTLEIFNRVANFKRLTPLSSDPDEWMNVSEYGKPDGVPGVWQNRRQGTVFSHHPNFQTYYDIDEPGRPLHHIGEPE